MSTEHRASIAWRRATPDFEPETYDRTHAVRFAAGQELQGTAAPEYHGDPAKVDPEQMLAAAVASCHMLTFLAIAAKGRLVVDGYEDDAVATLGRNEEGHPAVTTILLRPRVTFAGTPPSRERLRELHERAHRGCMIGASVRSTVVVDPTS